MFDFSSIFTPERMAQGAQGVQSINNMPWVFRNYLQQLLGQQAQQQPAPAAQPAPLPQMLGMGGDPNNATPDQNGGGLLDASLLDWLRQAQNDGGGGA